MLKYLLAVSGDLIVVAILTGLLYAWVESRLGGAGQRALNVGMLAGFAGAAVMSYMKNATNLVHTGVWNMRIFVASTLLLLLFFAFSLPKLREKAPKLSGRGVCVTGAALAALLLFYEMPEVYAYPYTMTLLGFESVFSTDYIYRVIGWLLGLILMLVIFSSARRVAAGVGGATAAWVTAAALSLNAVQQITKTLQTMLTRRIIKSSRGLFQVVKFTSNHSDLFVYGAIAAVILLALILWLRSLRVNEPYANPAEHRRIRAKWRDNRRWASALLACCLLMILNLTVFTALLNREVELSPAEDFVLQDGNIYISLTQVEDGHLHRFAYLTGGGVETRFIVIKKPNSSAYGIGLDACDICGETGYYERDGQVVCKLCDVVMNINTIGFKGGCNPIPIAYSVADGYIVVPVSELEAHEKDFR